MRAFLGETCKFYQKFNAQQNLFMQTHLQPLHSLWLRCKCLMVTILLTSFIIKLKVSIFPSDTEQLLLCYSQWHTDQNRDNIHPVAIFRSVSRHGMVRSTRERKTELITNKIFYFAKLKEYEKKSDNDIDNLSWQCVSRSGIVWHFHLELY